MSTDASWVTEAKRREGEPLHPDLEPWLYDGHGFGVCLKHPLVFDIPFWPGMAWRDNDQYAYKLEALAEAEKAGEWHTAVFLHEKPYRHSAFAARASRMPDEVYWELLGAVWTNTENLWQWGANRRLIQSTRPGRSNLMTTEELVDLAKLPDEIKVWRGTRTPRGTRVGWSWTSDYDKAVWFSLRLLGARQRPVVLEATIAKTDVLAHFTRRNESEIVSSPGKFRNVREV